MTVAQQVDTGAIAGGAQAPATVKTPWWEHAALYRYGFVVVLLIVWEIVGPIHQPDLFHLSKQDCGRFLRDDRLR